jgi:cholesterol 25-hydroxylase
MSATAHGSSDVLTDSLTSSSGGLFAGNQSANTSSTSSHLDVDFRLLQPIWDLRIGHESMVASPLFPIVISLTLYAVGMIPFTIVDLFGRQWTWIQRYKIQPDRQVGWPQVKRAMALTAWNHVLYILPVSVAQCVWTPDTVLPAAAPTLWQFFWQQVAALLVFDAEYYLWHLIHHRSRWLYRRIHAVHHQFSSPSVWVSEYLHPWELFSIGVFTTTSPMLFGAHPLTVWSFMQFSIIISIDDHCGYDLPLLPHRWLPFWGGSIHHDMHHQRPLTNFEPFLTHWDRMFGSFCPGQRAGGVKPKSLLDWERRGRRPCDVMEFEFGQADAQPLAELLTAKDK